MECVSLNQQSDIHTPKCHCHMKSGSCFRDNFWHFSKMFWCLCIFPNLIFWGLFLSLAVFLYKNRGKKLSPKRSFSVNGQYLGAHDSPWIIKWFHYTQMSKVCQNKLHWDIPWCFRKEKKHCSLFSRMQSLALYRQGKEASWRHWAHSMTEQCFLQARTFCMKKRGRDTQWGCLVQDEGH